MEIDFNVKDVVLAEVTFTDLSIVKKRPLLIIERLQYGDLLTLPVSSIGIENLKEGEKSISNDDFEEGEIPKASKVFLLKPYICNQTVIIKKYGKVYHNYFKDILKAFIFNQTKNYFQSVHKPVHTSKFTPGKSKIHYAGRVFDEKEMINLVDSSLDFWLTAGKYADKFEKRFAEFMGVKHCSLTNSGSSANLLAFTVLTSPKLGDRRIKRGDEVITVAAGFPTTVSPIIQYGAAPVFVDVTIPEYNIDCSRLADAVSEKTKAVFLAHTMGNPFDVERVMAFCEKYNLWLIEDNCDALGSQYKGKLTGTFGHIATQSFYPPHHMTMGEGGAVITNDPFIKKLVESLRDWGRDCWCPSGHDNTCGNRFGQQLGGLPHGYDHKYVYSHFGYNLKATDMQAAIGCAQLEKLPAFIETRKQNWRLLRDGLAGLSDKFILPEAIPDSDPSWFGFLLTVREGGGFTRNDIVNHLESNRVQTRMLFAGNLLKHPCFDEMREVNKGYKIVSNLKNTDTIMNKTFWIGVYPGMTKEMIEFMVELIRRFHAGKDVLLGSSEKRKAR